MSESPKHRVLAKLRRPEDSSQLGGVSLGNSHCGNSWAVRHRAEPANTHDPAIPRGAYPKCVVHVCAEKLVLKRPLAGRG